MKVFVAGASGVVGRPLVRQLVEARPRGGRDDESIGERGRDRGGGRGVRRCDALTLRPSLRRSRDAAPEVVISQLTRLPRDYNPRKIDYGPSNRARTEGGHNLIEAATAIGVRRFVTQSIAFIYAPEGAMVKDEEAEPWTDPPEPFARRRQIRPSTTSARWWRRRGSTAWCCATGSSTGRAPTTPRTEASPSRCVDVASRSSAAAEERSRSSTPRTPPRPRWPPSTAGRRASTTSSTTSPLPGREWLPVYAEALGAKPPRRVPTWLARMVAGRFAVIMATELRGASNAKAKRELGWEPRYPSWRTGFSEALG